MAENFNPNLFDPIVVWEDNRAAGRNLKKVFVLSGHSRYEGLKRRKAKTVPVRFFQGSEKEAIHFAKVEANRSQERENLGEDIQAFQIMRDGDKQKGIEPATNAEIKRIFKDKYNKLDHFSHLNPNGLFMQALSQGNVTEYPYIERTASWVGILRKEYGSKITNLMEDNCFNFFYADPQGKNIKIAKDQFMKLIESRINTMKSDERLLFTQDGQIIDKAKSLIEDKLKGNGYKRLKELNETLKFLSDRLTTTDRKLKVWTKEEEVYLKETLGPKLEEEKKRIERDINYLDEQKSLFGLVPAGNRGCQFWKCAIARRPGSESPKCRCTGCHGSAHGLGGVTVKVCNRVAGRCKPCQTAFKKALAGITGSSKKKPATKKKTVSSSAKKARKSSSVKKSTAYPRRAYPRRTLAGLEFEPGRRATVAAAPAEIPAPAAPIETPEQPTVASVVNDVKGLANDIAGMFRNIDEATAIERPTFTLPGNVGRFMGRIEQFEYAVVLRGQKGSGKSTLIFRLLDAFASWGMKSAFLSLEMNPASAVIKDMTEKYLKPENKAMIKITDAINTIDGIKKIAPHFPVIVIDSWTKLRNVKQEDFDELRKQFPETIFIIIFQSTTSGTARSGFMAEYDAGAVIQVEKTDQGGRAIMEKNRYSEGENYQYYVHKDKLIDPDKAGRPPLRCRPEVESPEQQVLAI